MIRLIVVTVILLGIAMALLSVRVILKKGGRFSRGHACQFNPDSHKRPHKQRK
ncbi:MAG: hypothetical protein NC217_02930 [Muribaculaceae bacterium]|nr:hypothetical protein [Muribaculaceae bacterium]